LCEFSLEEWFVSNHVTFKWNIDLEIQALRVYLRLLGHCSRLTGFASSRSIARSIHPLIFHYCHYCQQ